LLVLEKNNLPESWELCKIDDFTKSRKIGIDRSQKEQFDDGIPYLKMNNITIDGTLDLSSMAYIECSEQEKNNYLLEYGDIVFNTRNSFELVGKTAFWDDSVHGCVYNNNIMRIRLHEVTLPKFLVYFMNSTQFRNTLLSIKRATTNICAIYDKDLKEQLAPIPPLNEQKRIVSKIEELFSQIDVGEKYLKETLGILHARVTKGKNVLFENNIDRFKILRLSILKKAFEGKLVPQDPNDEPASELLKRIKASNLKTA